MSDNSIIIEARNLHKSYPMGRSRQYVLRGVQLRVARGEFVAIMGASGSGKSTFLHILGILDRPDKGKVLFEGQEVFSQSKRIQDQMRSRDIGFVFQFYHLLPELNVEENILLPLMVDSSVLGWPSRKQSAKKRVKELLTLLGLENQTQQKPATLSGGERQRVALARALVENPKLLLADEPTGNLDSQAGKVILEHLKRLNQEGQTIIMVTHDANVARLADRTVKLQDGKIS